MTEPDFATILKIARPLSFSPEMVRAIGRREKCVTRRTRIPGVAGDYFYVREAYVKREDGSFRYKADMPASDSLGLRYAPPFLMPRIAARTLLRCTSVVRQHLHEMDDEEARREGCRDLAHFKEVWDSLNGDKCTFASNPKPFRVAFSIEYPACSLCSSPTAKAGQCACGQYVVPVFRRVMA
jgi:hypothetical protein